MESDYEEPNDKKNIEIKKMAKLIMLKYSQYHYNFALEIAEELYNNNIYLEHLNESNNTKSLHLEEIIIYISKKLERKKKIISINGTKKNTYQDEDIKYYIKSTTTTKNPIPDKPLEFRMKPIEPIPFEKHKKTKKPTSR